MFVQIQLVSQEPMYDKGWGDSQVGEGFASHAEGLSSLNDNITRLEFPGLIVAPPVATDC